MFVPTKTENLLIIIYGQGLIAEESKNGYRIYQYDLRGSTVALTNQSGKVTDRCTYGTYGEMVSHTGCSDTPFLYDGRDGVMTDGNGLYYMRARYYSPLLKRFINPDTLDGSINDSRTLNKYAMQMVIQSQRLIRRVNLLGLLREDWSEVFWVVVLK